MNETSLRGQKLVSLLCSSRLALAQGAQATSADAHPDRAISSSNRDLLQIGRPAPLGVALRETDVVPELRPFAADPAPVSHAIHSLTAADWIDGLVVAYDNSGRYGLPKTAPWYLSGSA